jgi:hypothetical protein
MYMAVLNRGLRINLALFSLVSFPLIGDICAGKSKHFLCFNDPANLRDAYCPNFPHFNGLPEDDPLNQIS